MDNLKFPQTWEQAKRDTEIIKIVSTNGGYMKEYAVQSNEAAKLMAERYEERIGELEMRITELESENKKLQIFKSHNLPRR